MILGRGLRARCVSSNQSDGLAQGAEFHFFASFSNLLIGALLSGRPASNPTKRNETKRNETKRNETKRNEWARGAG